MNQPAQELRLDGRHLGRRVAEPRRRLRDSGAVGLRDVELEQELVHALDATVARACAIYRRPTMFRADADGRMSVETRLATECELAEELVRAVGAERVHEGTCAHIAVGTGEGAAVEVAGAAGE